MTLRSDVSLLLHWTLITPINAYTECESRSCAKSLLLLHRIRRWKAETRRKDRHTIGSHRQAKRQLRNHRLSLCPVSVASASTAVGIPPTSAPSCPGTVSVSSADGYFIDVLVAPTGLRSVATALVGLHAPAYGLGTNASTYLDVGLLDADAANDGPATAAAVLGRQHPLPIGLG
jgi:hypothetical protein